MKNRKRQYRPQGNVNFNTKPRNSIYQITLKNKETGIEVKGYFYKTRTEWIGYSEEKFKDAPCNHCGQSGIFQNENWTHTCPAISQGVELPCKLPHECKQLPSFAWHGSTIWPESIWEEYG